MKYLCILLFCSSLIFYSCENNNAEELIGCNTPENDTTNVTYILTIKPILDANCVSCHTPGNVNGNVRLDEYHNAAANGELLLQVLDFDGVRANMPPTGKLDPCTINKFTAWVNQGKKE